MWRHALTAPIILVGVILLITALISPRLSSILAPATPSQAAAGVTGISRFGNGEADLFVRSGESLVLNQVHAPVTASGLSVTLLADAAFADGDMVLLYQSQGVGAGNGEFNRIVAINGLTWTLEQPLRHQYQSGGTNSAQAVRVEQFRNVQVDAAATLTAPAWDGDSGGMLVFLTSGEVDIRGFLDMRGKGFYGGFGNGSGVHLGNFCPFRQSQQGHSAQGSGQCAQSANQGGGGGGTHGPSGPHWGGGGGGGHATTGASGNGPRPGSGGLPYAEPGSGKIYLGAGGGGGAWETNPYGGGRQTIEDGNDDAGRGGGVIWVQADTIRQLNAAVDGWRGGSSVNPVFGGYGGGGGAGGTIKLVADTVNLVNFSLAGGAGGRGRLGNGGSGGIGVARVETCSTPPIIPGASVAQIDCVPPVAYYTTSIDPRVRFGEPLTITWDAVDDSNSAVNRFTLLQATDDETYVDALRGSTEQSYLLLPDQACRVLSFELTAEDDGGNTSEAVLGQLQVSLQGDFDASGGIDTDDLAIVAALDSVRAEDPEYVAWMDVNSDGSIDAADIAWIQMRVGDTCPTVNLSPITAPSPLPVINPTPVDPQPSGTGSIVSLITPQEGGRVAVDSTTELIFPPDAVDAPTQIVLEKPASILQATDPISTGFSIKATSLTGGSIAQFNQPYTLQFNLRSAQDRPQVSYWDVPTTTWLQASISINSESMQAFGMLEQATTIVITSQQENTLYLPLLLRE
ncbi:MAG: hypothetical protein HC822_03670 [Oscillochloris sp.]|nr:hypothetical protein [Oscillochloris sp.]